MDTSAPEPCVAIELVTETPRSCVSNATLFDRTSRGSQPSASDDNSSRHHPRPHPCVTASPLSLEERALARVSKDGGERMHCVPSFETLAEFIIGPRFARTRWQAPQDEVSIEARRRLPA